MVGAGKRMKREYANFYEVLEERHWWFRARREVLKSLLDQSIPWRPGMRILEVGVGPGLNLYTLYPQDADLHGLDPDPVNSARARERGNWPVHTGTIEHLPDSLWNRAFDLVALFDVLEHIRDDGKALEILHSLVRAGGYLALAVPAYMWMWGRQDEVSMHFRRYRRSTLVNLVEAKGFGVLRATYFNTFLFAPVAIRRLLARCFPFAFNPHVSDFKFGAPWLDEALYRIFRSEAWCLRRCSFPFGVSIFVLATPKA